MGSCCVALSFVLVGITVIRWAWRVLDWVWLKPRKLERCLRQQGLNGKPYRLFLGDTKENSMMLKQTQSKPIKHSTSHDIAPRVIPFQHLIVNSYGKNSFIWMGTRPRVNIMNPEDLRDPFYKYDTFQKLMEDPLRKLFSGLGTINGEKWAKHRKIINPAFHLEKLKGSCELDVWSSLESLTSDVISRAAFGSSDGEGRKIFQLLKEQTRIFAISLRSVYITGWSFLPTKMNKRMKGINKELRRLLKGIINKKEEAIKTGEAPKDDLLGILLVSNSKETKEHGGNNKNAGMSIEDVIDECKLFYFAGQDTTSVLLVTMILYEVLRLYPPGVALSRITDKKTQLGKLSLPAGVEVSLPTLLLHHDKELWGDDADEFKPERFSEGISKATNNRFTYFPFGAGPRICIGQNFAIMEAKMALSLILLHFNFELSPSYVHAPSVIITLQPQFGAHIIVNIVN
ncbi:unnamed protein product [Malus fusca]